LETAVPPAKTSPVPWDALADVDAFVDGVLAELKAMAKDGRRPMRSGPKPPLAGAALRKAVMAIWCVHFCSRRENPSVRKRTLTSFDHPQELRLWANYREKWISLLVAPRE
jgi:hypothetical protein